MAVYIALILILIVGAIYIIWWWRQASGSDDPRVEALVAHLEHERVLIMGLGEPPTAAQCAAIQQSIDELRHLMNQIPGEARYSTILAEAKLVLESLEKLYRTRCG